MQNNFQIARDAIGKPADVRWLDRAIHTLETLRKLPAEWTVEQAYDAIKAVSSMISDPTGGPKRG